MRQGPALWKSLLTTAGSGEKIIIAAPGVGSRLVVTSLKIQVHTTGTASHNIKDGSGGPSKFEFNSNNMGGGS